MNPAEYARSQARAVRYAERARWEERNRAFELIEMAVTDKPEDAEVDAKLWDLAAQIMKSKA